MKRPAQVPPADDAEEAADEAALEDATLDTAELDTDDVALELEPGHGP